MPLQPLDKSCVARKGSFLIVVALQGFQNWGTGGKWGQQNSGGKKLFMCIAAVDCIQAMGQRHFMCTPPLSNPIIFGNLMVPWKWNQLVKVTILGLPNSKWLPKTKGQQLWIFYLNKKAIFKTIFLIYPLLKFVHILWTIFQN